MSGIRTDIEWTPAVCTRCGCICDDLQAGISENQIVDIRQACPQSRAWFLAEGRSEARPPMVRGKSVDWETALRTCAQILTESHSPLICGLSDSSTEGHRAAIELAERIGAVIDPSLSPTSAATTIAMQFAGQSTSTLGEVRQRADVIVFWRSNPVVTHPRFLERFCHPDQYPRTILVVDSTRTETAEVADHFLQIEPDTDIDVLSAVRALVAGVAIGSETVGGFSRTQLEQLTNALRQARYGAVFYGSELANSSVPHLAVESLLRLVTDLNTTTRCVARAMRPTGGETGAENVLAWQTGYSRSVSFANGSPRSNPGEFSAWDLLSGNVPDTCVLLSDDQLQKLPPASLEFLGRISTIAILNDSVTLPFEPTVRFFTGTAGIHATGTAYRMDEVSLPLPKLINSERQLDYEVLREIGFALQGAARP